MVETVNLDRLIEHLGTAHGPDPELDALIELETMPAYMKTRTPEGYVQVNRKGTVLCPVWEDWQPRGAPRYTASLDAALALVPEGWELTLRNRRDLQPEKGCMADVGKYRGTAETIPVALCIAVLKARKGAARPAEPVSEPGQP